MHSQKCSFNLAFHFWEFLSFLFTQNYCIMKWLFFSLSLFISCIAYTQSTDETYQISTDRPSVSFAASTVPKKVFQAEIGYNHIQQNVNYTVSSLPNMAIRYGLINGIELRIVSDYNFSRFASEGATTNQNGLAPLQLGAKVVLFGKEKNSTKIAVISQFAFQKLASESFQGEGIQVLSRILVEHSLQKGWGVFYNIGPDITKDQTTLSWTLGLGKSIGKSNFYLENFGTWQDGKNGLGSNIGYIYALSHRFQLDLAAGLGLNDASADWFSTLGFSFYVN